MPVIMKTSSSSSPETTKKRDWIELINESVHTSDDIDLGDIDAISRDFVVVKRGFVNIHYYYIPISKVEGWDGNVLWLKITELTLIPTRYARPIYTTTTTTPPREDIPKVFKCDLCEELDFKTEDELSVHVKERH